jgi:hypothetical protein
MVAATTIGERGTQLAMRTFHSGGVSGQNTMSGFPRVRAILQGQAVKTPKGLWSQVAGNGDQTDAIAETNRLGDLADLETIIHVFLYEMYSGYNVADIDPRHFEVILASMLDERNHVRGLNRTARERLNPLEETAFRNARSALRKLAGSCQKQTVFYHLDTPALGRIVGRSI